MVDINKYFNGEYYNINGIKIANVRNTIYDEGMQNMLTLDSFGQVYGYTNEEVEQMGGEGLYIHKDFDIEVGDIVIDAGGFIGDFSAYAVSRGATSYAFEPMEVTYKFLTETAKLNEGKIFPIKKGLSNKNKRLKFYSDETHPGSDTTNVRMVLKRFIEFRMIITETITYFRQIFNLSILKALVKFKSIELVKLDDFVKEHNIPHVDFIKADIEGAERYMLEGARETIKKYLTKLSICTYHLKDDPEVLEKLIKDIEPRYIVIQNKKKLYAYVLKEKL